MAGIIPEFLAFARINENFIKLMNKCFQTRLPGAVFKLFLVALFFFHVIFILINIIDIFQFRKYNCFYFKLILVTLFKKKSVNLLF